MTAPPSHLEVFPAWITDLKRGGACENAIKWAAAYPTLAEAWAACERADWMLWWAGRCTGEPQSVSRRRLGRCACACWRRGVPAAQQQGVALTTIETVERWARGDEGTTLDHVRQAADAAAASAYTTAAADAADAAERHTVFSELADLVREHYPKAPTLERDDNESSPSPELEERS